MKDLKELQVLILEWAKERDLLHKENATNQRLKLIEECGELASAILKNKIDEQKDAIGDIFVVLVILAEQLNDNQNLDIYKVDFYSYSSEYNLIQQLINSYNSGLVEVLFNLAIRLDLDLVECANLAWNEIKYRKGVTVNGTFIKENSLD